MWEALLGGLSEMSRLVVPGGAGSYGLFSFISARHAPMSLRATPESATFISRFPRTGPCAPASSGPCSARARWTCRGPSGPPSRHPSRSFRTWCPPISRGRPTRPSVYRIPTFSRTCTGECGRCSDEVDNQGLIIKGAPFVVSI